MASFGESLKRERELRGVELREMADATKISIRFLKALEQDRVDILPGGIFPKAFVRQYAKHLGLDPERLVAEFVYAQGGEPEAGMAKMASVPVSEPGSYRGLVITLLILGLLGFLAWQMWGAEQDSGDDEAASASAPLPGGPAAAVSTDRVYPPPTAPAAAPLPSGKLVVALAVRENSWAEAKVDGTIAFSRVLNAGENQHLEAKDEVILSVGNAGGIALTVNGRPGISLGRTGEVRRNIAINAQSIPSLVSGPAPGAYVSAVPLATPRPASPRPRRPSPTPPPPVDEPADVDTEASPPAPTPSPSPTR